MNKGMYPNVVSVKKLINREWPVSINVYGKQELTRPVSAPTLRERCVIAWRVFIGKYDALDWHN